MPGPVLETAPKRAPVKQQQRDHDRLQQEIIEENLQEARTPKAHELDSELTLHNRMGIPEGRDLDLSKIESRTKLTKEQQDAVKKLWVVARIDPRSDRGQDLQLLLNAIDYDPSLTPEVLEQLHAVATADTLFGRSKKEVGDKEFEKLRREFLVDVIRAAVNSDTIVQGKESLCTATAACKIIPHGEFVRLATDLALNGKATTASGAELALHERFFDRAQTMTHREMHEVRSRHPSAGMLMMLYGVMQLGDTATNPSVPLIERQEGSYWHQYTVATEKLTGRKMACAGNDATIHLDSKGNAVREGESGAASETSLYGYVESQVRSGKQVWIDTKFNFSSQDLNYTVGQQHGRHALVAEGLERRNGETWIRCANPIGDFVNTSRSTRGHAEMFPVGTRLGKQGGFWFETAGNGDILVRADVLEQNIRTAMVSFNEEYTYTVGDKAEKIGSLDYNDGPVYFIEVDHGAEEVEAEEGSKAESINDALAAFDAVKTIVVEEQSEPAPATDHSWYRRQLEVLHQEDEELAPISATNEREQTKEREEDSPVWWSRESSSFAVSTLAQGEGLEKPSAASVTSSHSVDSQTESPTDSKVREEPSQRGTSSVATGFASTALFGSNS